MNHWSDSKQRVDLPLPRGILSWVLAGGGVAGGGVAATLGPAGVGGCLFRPLQEGGPGPPPRPRPTRPDTAPPSECGGHPPLPGRMNSEKHQILPPKPPLGPLTPAPHRALSAWLRSPGAPTRLPTRPGGGVSYTVGALGQDGTAHLSGVAAWEVPFPITTRPGPRSLRVRGLHRVTRFRHGVFPNFWKDVQRERRPAHAGQLGHDLGGWSVVRPPSLHNWVTGCPGVGKSE